MIRVDETDPVGEIEPAFPYRDVTVRRRIEFADYYDLETELGRGKFGTVHLCRDKKNNLKLAAKIVNTMKKEDRRAVEREVEIMRRLQHPRLIQLYDAIDNGKQFYVILELIEGGELFERVIDDDFVLTERSCAVFMRQICEGIEFVHGQNILHLDMKPENILCLTKEGNRIKIIDFGLARQFDPRKKLQVLFGTPEFVAPEVVNFDQIGFGTDMWSIGVICYVLLSGLSPFMGDTDVETMANVTIAKYDFDHEAFSDISEEAKDFIRCLLIKDREKRMTASQCRSCGWLARRDSSKGIGEAKKTVELSGNHTKLNTNSKAQVADTNPGNALDLSKDNLRLFVERWREHPNSPYRLEETSVHSDCIRNPESTSLCADSPSPPQSIHTDDSVFSEVSENNRDKLSYNIPNITLERRASEGNFHDIHVRDPASQIALAEEIIKLSEHLRTIAMESQESSYTLTSLKDEPDNKSLEDMKLSIQSPKKISRTTESRSKHDDKHNGSEVNEIYEKISKITRQRKLNGTTFNGTKNYDKHENILRTFKLKKPLNTLGRKHLLTNEMIPDQATKSNESWSSEHQKSPQIDENSQRNIDLTPPWRKTCRTKRRFSETCRDVPRISNLRDIHKSMNLDEPTTTKNLLLKLLEEWDERPESQIFGRKSISVDWHTENVSRQSINSLAEYFQSKQKKTTNSSIQHPSTSTYH